MNQETIWIVVAQQSEARIFVSEGVAQLRLIHHMENPEGRLKNQEIDTDRPGRSFSSASNQRHGFSPSTESSEQVTIDFSKEIAHYLEEARNHERFDSLVLITGPQFLGQLRKDLSKTTSDRISRTIGKNLGGFSEHEISEYLREGVLDGHVRSHDTDVA